MSVARNTEVEFSGKNRLRTGAAAGLAGGIVGVVLPVAFLWLTVHNPSGFFTSGLPLFAATSSLVLAGALLLLISLFVYRRAFVALRKVDGRFAFASVLCFLGSVGFLLILVSAAILLGSGSSLVPCLHQSASGALACLRSGQPFGADTGLLGFWLAWLGGLGIVVGLSMAGRRFTSRALTAGSVLYALLLVVLIGPFAGLFTPVPGVQYVLLVVPALIVLAPALVLAGAPHSPSS
jgi:hypothetical protein